MLAEKDCRCDVENALDGLLASCFKFSVTGKRGAGLLHVNGPAYNSEANFE